MTDPSPPRNPIRANADCQKGILIGPLRHLLSLRGPRRRNTPKATSAALLGYARVSKAEDQDTRPQIEALEAANCRRIFEEKASGGRWDRPELHRLLDRLGPGDILVVWKLDRLSRSLKDLLLILDEVERAGAGFRSLTENIDSTTPSGRMMMHMLGSFASSNVKWCANASRPDYGRHALKAAEAGASPSSPRSSKPKFSPCSAPAVPPPTSPASSAFTAQPSAASLATPQSERRDQTRRIRRPFQTLAVFRATGSLGQVID